MKWFSILAAKQQQNHWNAEAELNFMLSARTNDDDGNNRHSRYWLHHQQFCRNMRDKIEWRKFRVVFLVVYIFRLISFWWNYLTFLHRSFFVLRWWWIVPKISCLAHSRTIFVYSSLIRNTKCKAFKTLMIIMCFILAHFITVRYKLVKSEAKQIEHSMPHTKHTPQTHFRAHSRAHFEHIQFYVFIR